MQRVSFDAVVGVLDASVGIVNSPQAYLLAASETQAGTESILELKGGPKIIVFYFGVFESRDSDTRFQVRFYRSRAELVHEHWRK